MADINSPTAINFSNKSVRPGTDLCAQAYYRCDSLADRWGADEGTVAEKKVTFAADLLKAADSVIAAHKHTFYVEKVWFLGTDALFPDQAGDQVIDGSPSSGRPGPNTGAKVNAAITRFRQFNNWVRTGDFDDFGTGNDTTINRILAVSSMSPSNPSDADVQNFIDLCAAIQIRYEANSNQELNTLLALSVNPNPVG